MKQILFLVSVAVVLVMNSCNQSNTKNAEQQAASPEPVVEKPVMKLSELTVNKDLVCGMPLEEGGIADTTLLEGKMYGFCAAECKAEFVKNPSAYLAQQ